MTRASVVFILAFGLLVTPLAVKAQPAGKVGEPRSIRLRTLVAAGHLTKRNEAP